MKAKKYAMGGASMQQQQAALDMQQQRQPMMSAPMNAVGADKGRGSFSPSQTQMEANRASMPMNTQMLPTADKAMVAMGGAEGRQAAAMRSQQQMPAMQQSKAKRGTFSQADYAAMQQARRQPRPMMAKGGMVAANCGASMKPTQKRK